jgi:predicted aldo/keto reductase-like oxidoreductase
MSSISRRRFLETTAFGSAAAASALGAGKIPTRVLGRTGKSVSILAFGSGSRFLMYKEEDKALEALTRALDLGITYIDTAYGYGNGASEERIGKLMPARRKQVFLATKVNRRKGDEAMRIVEGSLKRLQTDHLDLLHIHALSNEDDLKAIEAPDGVLKVVLKLRDEKVARAIGITCHQDPVALKSALERHDFDCTQMALNAARAGMASGRGRGYSMDIQDEMSFEKLALPVAKRKKMGVIAMKVMAQEMLVGKAPVEKLVRYALSLPVTTAVIGMPALEHIDQNIEIARNFKPLSPAEMQDMSRVLATQHKAAIDRFFANHVDA